MTAYPPYADPYRHGRTVPFPGTVSGPGTGSTRSPAIPSTQVRMPSTPIFGVDPCPGGT
jgi:hypothetical protein